MPSDPINDTVAENSTAALGSVDLDAVTLETCLEAGVIKAVGQ